MTCCEYQPSLCLPPQRLLGRFIVARPRLMISARHWSGRRGCRGAPGAGDPASHDPAKRSVSASPSRRRPGPSRRTNGVIPGEDPWLTLPPRPPVHPPATRSRARASHSATNTHQLLRPTTTATTSKSFHQNSVDHLPSSAYYSSDAFTPEAVTSVD